MNLGACRMGAPAQILAIFAIFAASLAAKCTASLITDEQRILSALMLNYLPSTPPRLNQSEPITVEVSFRLNQIIDLDERSQILTTNVFIEQRWNDTKLSWVAGTMSQDTKLRISADKVWLPDTYVFNNADSRKSGFLRSVYVLLQPNGQVSWPVPDKLRTTCQVNIANFPFDYQKCSIRLGSWVHSSRQLIYLPRTPGSIDEIDYTDNSEWQLLSARPIVRTRRLNVSGHLGGGRPTIEVASDDKEFTDLVVELVIRRRSFFYVWNIILPCVMLSVLTLFSFRVPPDNCEKISMGLSVFLAFSMFMLLVAEQVPATSESVPLIGLYITVLMSMTTVSVIFSVCIVNLNHRGSKFRPPPSLLKKFFVDWLGRLLRVAESVEKAARQFEVADSLAYRKTTDEYQHRMSGIRAQIAFFRDCLQLRRLEDELNSMQCSSRHSGAAAAAAAAGRHRAGPTAIVGDNNDYDEDDYDNDYAEEFDEPLRRWLSPRPSPNTQQQQRQQQQHLVVTPARVERLRHFQSACAQLPFLDSGDCSSTTPEAAMSSRRRPQPLPPQSPSVASAAPSSSLPPHSVLSSSSSSAAAASRMPTLSRVVTEWKLIALVVDTLFFYLFLIGTVLVYLYLFYIFPSINLQHQSL